MGTVFLLIIRDSLNFAEFNINCGRLRINETNGNDKLGQIHDFLLFFITFFLARVSKSADEI